MTAAAAGSVSLTSLNTASTQDFNSLASSGTSTALPTGWYFSETGTNANTTYTADTGSNTAGDTYSFGGSASTERAFGTLRSSSLNSSLGAQFTNNTGSTITTLNIGYTGEQWRSGATGRTDKLDFQYSTDATSLTTGTWTDANALDFSSVSNTTTGAMDGNTNHSTISSTLTGVSIPNGASFWIRWADSDVSGADDGLAIDDFSITATGSSPAPTVEIFNIQGSGLKSPYENQTVTTSGNIVTSVVKDASGKATAFYMQTPTALSDGDGTTSDGLYVYLGTSGTYTGMDIKSGDAVTVVGKIIEYQASSNGVIYAPVTEISSPTTVTVTSRNQPLPTAFTLNSTFPSSDITTPTCGSVSNATPAELDFECMESMLVQVNSGVVNHATWDYINFSTHDDLYVSATGTRSFREKGLLYADYIANPELQNLPLWDNTPELFKVSVNELGLSADDIDGGTTFTATGVIADNFRTDVYSLIPSKFTVTKAATLPVAVRAATSTELSIGSLNTYNFFDSEDDAAYSTPSQCTMPDGSTVSIEAKTVEESDILSTTELNTKLTKISQYIRDVLNKPTVVALQEVESFPAGSKSALDALVTQINADLQAKGEVARYAGAQHAGNDARAINVAYLYRTDAGVLASVTTQALGGNECLDYETLSEDQPTTLLHDRTPTLLTATYTANGLSFPFAVLNIHDKSFLSMDYDTAVITDDMVREKRLKQALSVAKMVKDFVKAHPGTALTVVGDYNDYQFTDGYVDVVGTIAGTAVQAENLLWQQSATCLRNCGLSTATGMMTDAVTLIDDTNQRYSYVHEGNLQVLDHALLNAAAKKRYQGLVYARGNADVEIGAYKDDPSTPLGTSDHDGFVLFLNASAR